MSKGYVVANIRVSVVLDQVDESNQSQTPHLRGGWRALCRCWPAIQPS